jgi:predicted DNA-binding protein (MmcQ/YjbR family)
MNIEEFREYCIKKKGVTEEFPFGIDTLVFKVMGKMFALTSLTEKPFSVNLKMNVEIVEEWREKYDDIKPGYHMNKKMWNTVTIGNGNISIREFYWMIDHSYGEVVKGLPQKTQEQLNSGN